MLAHDIAHALPLLRSEAEARMVDACRITRGPYEPGTFDPDTGTWTPAAETAIYEGKCEAQVADAIVARPLVVGDTKIVVIRLIVKIPVAVVGVRINDEVVITTSINDADLAGKRYRVLSTHIKTYATARRLHVEEIEE